MVTWIERHVTIFVTLKTLILLGFPMHQVTEIRKYRLQVTFLPCFFVEIGYMKNGTLCGLPRPPIPGRHREVALRHPLPFAVWRTNKLIRLPVACGHPAIQTARRNDGADIVEDKNTARPSPSRHGRKRPLGSALFGFRPV